MIEEIQRQTPPPAPSQTAPHTPPRLAQPGPAQPLPSQIAAAPPLPAPRPAPLPTPTVRSAQPPALPAVAARQPAPRKNDAYVPPANAQSTLGAQHERIQAAKRPPAPVQTAIHTEDAREREIVRRAQSLSQGPTQGQSQGQSGGRGPVMPSPDLPPRPPADIPSVPPKRAKGIVTNSIS